MKNAVRTVGLGTVAAWIVAYAAAGAEATGNLRYSITVSKFEKPRHVSGQELSDGLRRYAIEQFGLRHD